jgi:hypothetical protein
VEEKIKTAIEVLAKSVETETFTSDNSLRYSQAILNLAQSLSILNGIRQV